MNEAKAKDNVANLDDIKEANLVGHLQNGNGNKDIIDTSDSDNKASNKDLITTDYQLYEALNLLKGLSAVNNQTSTSSTAVAK